MAYSEEHHTVVAVGEQEAYSMSDKETEWEKLDMKDNQSVKHASAIAWSPHLRRFTVAIENNIHTLTLELNHWDLSEGADARAGDIQEIAWIQGIRSFVAMGSNGVAMSEDGLVWRKTDARYNEKWAATAYNYIQKTLLIVGEKGCMISSSKAANIMVSTKTDSISPDTGAIVTNGGLGVCRDVNIGGTMFTSMISAKTPHTKEQVIQNNTDVGLVFYKDGDGQDQFIAYRTSASVPWKTLDGYEVK
jgi:hypothetical protein